MLIQPETGAQIENHNFHYDYVMCFIFTNYIVFVYHKTVM